MHSVVTALVLCMMPQVSQAAEIASLSYALTKTRVAAGVSQRITSCPPPIEDRRRGATYDITFDYTVLIEAKAVPARLVTIDPRSGFLVDRTTKMTFNEDGLTLKEYNATATGQGGPLIVSLIKAAAAVYGMTANPLALAAVAAPAVTGKAMLGGRTPERPRLVSVTRYYLACRPAVIADLARLASVKDDIAALEANTVAGTPSPAQVDLLARRRAEQARLEKGLTLDAAADSPLEPVLLSSGATGTMDVLIKPAAFDKWFVVVSHTAKVDARTVTSAADLDPDRPFTVLAKLAALPGRIRAPDGSLHDGPMAGLYGYEVKLKLDPATLRWFSCGGAANAVSCSAQDVGDGDIPDSRSLVYRRPVGGSVQLVALDQPCAAPGRCVDAMPEEGAGPKWLGRDEVSGSGVARFPQLSRLLYLPTGGSIFGSRTVGATFDANGAPTMLQFDKGGGSKDASGIIDAAVAAGQSASGARLAATKTQIDELQSAKTLHDLLTPQLDAAK